jgi:hypothetical protein
MVEAMQDDERAASEQIGFILMLGALLLTTIGGTVFGVGQLGELQNDGAFQQAESEFSTIQSQHYEVAAGVPYRSEEVALSDGRLAYGDTVSISYEVTNETGDELLSKSFETREVTYDAADERLVYVSGAVFRESTREGTSLMRSEPQLSTSNYTGLIIPYLNVRELAGRVNL